MFIYASRDKDEIFRADCTYRMCIMELNRRNHDRWPCEMDVISYVNIYDEDGEILFGYGRQYQMYIIHGSVLVYDDDWVPYLFSSREEDKRCIWKYFCVSREEKTDAKYVTS
ncbi:hypothetical protein [Sporofaciens musculi]|uniref:hypothetical protein n=1 Tax=Sporofaciens musculi TaxID=2681861 RepID=UPI00259CDB56|nr:hypothetical protein [Sporofaciens musculi]